MFVVLFFNLKMQKVSVMGRFRVRW